MRRTALALSLALLAACGGSSGPKPPLYGGYTPVAGTAIVFPPTTCDIPFLGVTSVSGVAVTLTDFADVCAFHTQTALCGSRANSTFLMAVAVGGVVGGTTSLVGPGTYPYLADPPTGTFRAAIGSAVRTTGTCTAQPSTSLDMTGGQVVLSEVSQARVTGSLNLVFEDGTAYQQPFDVARCDPPADLCSLLVFGSCLPGFDPWTCVQPPPP